jgi:hypothetical protein
MDMLEKINPMKQIVLTSVPCEICKHCGALTFKTEKKCTVQTVAISRMFLSLNSLKWREGKEREKIRQKAGREEKKSLVRLVSEISRSRALGIS